MDSFKGSCTATQAGEAARAGILRADPDAEVLNIPVADGGEGTVESIISNGRGKWHACEVTGPMGGHVSAGYGTLNDRMAVIEMSAASGLLLVPKEELNPLIATTYGTGELIRAALDAGYRELLIGIGGSATNDGGMGMAQALGVSFRDAQGRELPFGGAALERLHAVDASGLDPRIADCRITVASDVRNPLFGADGASYVFGAQKGATPEVMERLDRALRHYADVLREGCGIDIAYLPGAGAAGGLGAALFAFLGADAMEGIDAVLGILSFSEKLAGVDFVLTGEGRTDGQTLFGKVPAGVAKVVKQHAPIPVFILTGQVGEGAEALYEHGVDGIYAIADGPITLDQSQARVAELLARVSESVARGVQAVRCAMDAPVMAREGRQMV
jgi:glycerate kinase